MHNPFKFGVVVKGADFCDRQMEMAEIESDIASGINITIISPRRYGKTSLILNLFDRLEGIESVYIDLMGITSINDFLDVYAHAFLEKIGGMQRFFELAKKIIPGIEKMELNFGPVGVDLRVSPTIRNVEEIISIPERLGSKVVVAFDEFQEITNVKEIDLLSVFRKKAQMFKNTTFIFAGSRRHVMNDIFSNPEKPFYRFSKVYNLEPLGKSETIGFLRHKFNSTIEEVQIGSDLLEHIYEVSNGHPYYVQYISHMIWNIAMESGKLELEDVERAANKVLQSERSMYEMLWDSLSSNQKAVLKNIAYDISPYELNMSAGSVKTALDKLVKMDIIQKGEKRYELVDPFLGMWMKMERVVL